VNGGVANRSPGELLPRSYDGIVENMNGIRRITCVCGKVIEGTDDDELLAKAQAHVAADHPDLVGKVTREDILARAEEL
jgi:hypothetical protein